MTTTKTKSLPGRVREFLRAWPAGTEREHRKVCSHYGSSGLLTRHQLYAARDAGFLTEKNSGPALNVSSRHSTFNVTGVSYTRTDKKASPYRPKGVNLDTYRTRYPWPWPTYMHWDKIQHSAARAVRGITHKLSPQMDYRESRREDRRLQLSFPNLIRTKTELDGTRTALEEHFSGTFKRKRNSWTQVVSYMVPTGEGLQLLFMEMLVQPRFRDDGTFDRFVEISSEDALKETQRLVRASSIVDKYKLYMEERNGNRHSTNQQG